MELTEKQKTRIARATKWIEENRDRPLDELRKEFTETSAKYLTELEGLSEEQVAFSPGEKQWSVKEVSLHVSNAVRFVGEGIQSLAKGEQPPNEQDRKMGVLDPDPGDFAAVVSLVAEAFKSSQDAFDVFDGNPNLEATANHPLFGPLNARAWAAFNIMHIRIHVSQVRRVKGDEGFPQ